jgi:DNA polymerase (family X)
MTNNEIAHIFERIAMILDMLGTENPFRIRAYEKAAQVISGLNRDIKDVYDEGGLTRLEGLPGIGKDLARKIEELVTTEKLQYLNDIEKKIPSGLLKIMEIEGLGPKKTKFLWKEFDVTDIKGLKALAKSGKLEDIKGWGPKSVENILVGLELQKKMAGRLPLGEALPLAQEIVEELKTSRDCQKIEIAGSLRRRKDTCGDIDILVTSKRPEKIMDLFCTLPHIERVIAKGKTKSTAFLKAGIDCDIRVVEPKVFGAALHYFTGSKDHNVHMRKRAVRKGITISEYGVYEGSAAKKGKLLASKKEEDIFAVVDLPFIEPELREDRGEIEAAQHSTLPALITEGDIAGDLHMHSTFSDGKDSMTTMAKAAKELGLTYIAMTDHASAMGMVKGIKKDNIEQYLKKIEEARKSVPGIHILSGAEVDIAADGSLYLPDSILKKLDWIIASVHQSFKQSKEDFTKRIIRAIQNPHVRCIGHLTTRMLSKREGMDINFDLALTEAKKHNVIFELNAAPERLDLPDVLLKRAKEKEVKICINSDAHSKERLFYAYGIYQARRGWLEKADVANTQKYAQFMKSISAS